MEILGIGLQELVFIFLVALIIMGPKDMQKAGRTIGRWLRNLVTSDGWKIFQQTSRELRTLPNRLIREANEELQQVEKDVNKTIGDVNARTSAPVTRSQPIQQAAVIINTPEDKTAKPESEPKQDA